MTKAENYLRAVEFRNPQWIPFNVYVILATWKKYGERMEELVMRHPAIFGAYEKGRWIKDFEGLPGDHKEGEYTDEWGCVWRNVHGGLLGQVIFHPLADWDNFKDYRPPDALTVYKDWERRKKRFDEAQKQGNPALGYGSNLVHRLCYLRGFENFMMDIATDSAILHELLNMAVQYNMKLIENFLEAGAKIMMFSDDLGIQNRLIMSPKDFRKHLGPYYVKMFKTCREAGAHVYLHTDGYILEIVDDLIEYGVTILNPEHYANGLDAIASTCKGKVCVDLSCGQRFPFLPPEGIFDYFEEIVEKLGAKEGGLMCNVEIYPDVPFENIEAIFQAVEKYL